MAELTFAFGATLDARLGRWSRHIVDHGPGQVVDTVAERRSVLDRPYRILVLAADSPLAEPALVAELQRRGRGVMAVWDPAQPRTKDLAVALGAAAVIDADATPAEFVRAALALVGARPELGSEMVVEPVPLAKSAPPPAGFPPAPRPGGAHRVAICGPATEEAALVAVEVARAAATGQRRVVVVDANELNPGVVQQLGLPVLPNLRIAVDAIRDRHHRLVDALLPVPAGGFWVLGGLADPAQWAELSPAEVAAVVDELAEGCEVVVVHAAGVAEDLSGYGGPDRFGITRRVLAEAHRVLGVGVASPAGIAQLATWLVQVRAVAPHTPVHLALVRAPEDRFRRRELTERLVADLAPASLCLLPADRRAERAGWDGSLLGRGPLRRSIASLAASVVPASPPSARRPSNA